MGVEESVKGIRERVREWGLKVREVKGRDHRVLLVEPKIHNGVDVLFIHGLGSVYNPSRDGEAARRLAASGFRVHLLFLPGQGSPPREVKGYEDLAEWAMDYVRSRGINRLVVVGHSLGGEVAKALAKKAKEEGLKVRGIAIAPAGKGRRDVIRRVLVYPYALYKALKNGVSIRQVLSYARLVGRDYVPPPREVEVVQGSSDRFVPKGSRREVRREKGTSVEEWMVEEYRRGAHYPLEPTELALKVAEAAKRLE